MPFQTGRRARRTQPQTHPHPFHERPSERTAEIFAGAVAAANAVLRTAAPPRPPPRLKRRRGSRCAAEMAVSNGFSDLKTTFSDGLFPKNQTNTALAAKAVRHSKAACIRFAKRPSEKRLRHSRNGANRLMPKGRLNTPLRNVQTAFPCLPFICPAVFSR